MTGKSPPRFWELWWSPSYWQKPVSMSKNWEDPFHSRSPGAARGVHIHQTWKPNSRSFSIIPACPVSSSAISAIHPRWPTAQAEAHTACEEIKSTRGNQRRLCTSLRVLGSSGRVSGTSQIFSDVSTVQHMARLTLWLETSLQLSCIPKKLFCYNGNQLPKDPCALPGIKRCKCTVVLQVSSTSSFSLSAFWFQQRCR